jgi:type IX secretion system PorP/SprF family membrane protein
MTVINTIFSKSTTFIALMILLLNQSFAQQDPQYSQYMYNHFIVNPAFAGSRDVMTASTVLRYQWANFDGAPRTQTLNISTPLKRKKIGLGLNVITDELGPKKALRFMGSYAYHIKLPNRARLAFGLRAGASSFTINTSKITFKDQADIYNTGGLVRTIVPSADYGMYYYSKNSYVSFSASQLLSGQISANRNLPDVIRLKPHIFLAAGQALQVSRGIILSPSFMIRAVNNSPVGVDLNLNCRIEEHVWVGVSYRKNVGIVLLTQIAVAEKIKFGYSYDYGINRLGTVAGSTHEFYLGYDIDIFKSKIYSTRYL